MKKTKTFIISDMITMAETLEKEKCGMKYGADAEEYGDLRYYRQKAEDCRRSLAGRNVKWWLIDKTTTSRTELEENFENYIIDISYSSLQSSGFATFATEDTSTNKDITTSPTSIQEKISLYNSLLDILRHHLEISLQSKEQVLSQSELSDKCSLESDNESNVVQQDLDKSIFTFMDHLEISLQSKEQVLSQSELPDKSSLELDNDSNVIQQDLDKSIFIFMDHLEISLQLKEQVLSQSELPDKSSLESDNDDNVVQQDLKNSIFVTFIADDDQYNSQYKKQLIKRNDKEDTSVYILFDKMRKIISSETQFFSSEEIFIKQAKFMENFTDDYIGNEYFQKYYPAYNYMNDNQLRTYFTWRTKTRNGDLTQTSLSYVFVYIYELINNIGIKNPNEGIEKLIWILKNYSHFENKIKKYLVEWIKNYYICNEFKLSFKEIIEKYELQDYYPTVVISSSSNKYSFDSICKISKYKIEDSVFIDDEKKKIIVHCVDKVIHLLTPLLSLYGTDFDELVWGSNETLYWWQPFRDAIYKIINSSDKKVIIAKNEIYILKNDQWMACKPPQYSQAGPLVLGYIVKRIEANLRVLTNYRYKLSPDRESLLKNILDHYGVSKKIITLISDSAFDEIIDETTKLEFFTRSSEKENQIVPSISKTIGDMIKEEPYITFMKMRNSHALKGEDNSIKRFNIQGQIMSHLVDNFEIMIPFESYMPTYEDMSNDQLRCYVTWRSKVKKGVYSEIPVSYMRLYVFELINKISETDAEKVIEKLALILRKYKNLNRSFMNFLITCIKDYYISEDFSMSFFEVLKKHSIVQFYPNVFIEYTKDLELEGFRQISNYDIKKSKFYSEQTAPMIHDCFKYVFEDVEQYFSDMHLNLRQTIAGKGYESKWWRPFRNVPCDIKPISEKKVVISSNEIYSFEKNEWTCKLMPEKDNTGTILIGYMFKRMEMKMREVLKYKYILSANILKIVERMNNQGIIHLLNNTSFEQAIDNAVLSYFKDKYPRVFTNPNALFEKSIEIKIDKNKLNKIREEADIIREKLTIEEEVPEVFMDLQSDIKMVTKSPEKFASPLEELCANLNKLQKEALKIILNELPSMPAIMELSQKNKIMPEILLDGINDMALDLIGDNLIETAEDNPFIYDDYLNEIKLCLEELNDGKNSS